MMHPISWNSGARNCTHSTALSIAHLIDAAVSRPRDTPPSAALLFFAAPQQ